MYKKVMGWVFLISSVVGLLLLLGGCILPRVEVRATQFDKLWTMTCYGDTIYCYREADKICPDGFKVFGTTAKKEHKTWYVEKLCGSSFGRRVGGQIPMECTADNHYYMEENKVGYITYKMYVKCGSK